ncbi:O-antigen ligase family protein [Chloroflexus sp.]|uniref:O-antigen ligase family protein n=1 Tax=Chloroflexus sp. TaxID=1904827 RepID=UPI002612AFBB|nr:O-antigen ligase family protein [uncultured Chloroflexus sp.]
MRFSPANWQNWSQWWWLAGAVTIGVGLAIAPPLTTVWWLLGLVALGLALADPVWPVALAILSVPFQQLVELPGGLSVTQFCFGLVALRLLWQVVRQSWPRPGLPGIALFGLIWTLGLAAVLTPLSRIEAIKETLRWGTVLLIYLAADWALRDPSRVAWRRAVLITCLLVAPAVTALIGIGQFLTGIGPESFAIGNGRVRAYGTIGQPNSFAGYLNQAWPLAVGMALALLETRQWRTARFWGTLCIIGMAGISLIGGLLASFSRGGWLGAAVGVLAIGVTFAGRYGRSMIGNVITVTLMTGLSGLILLNSGLLPASLSNRLTSIIENLRPFDARGVEITPANFAIVERMAHLQAALHMIEERPLFGVGPGNFSVAYERLVYSGETATWIKPWYDSRGHAHNYYLHIAAESGLIGATAYLIFLGSVWYTAIRAVRHAQDWMTRGIAIGGLGVVGALSGHNLFENLHVLNMGVQFGVVIALLATINAGRLLRPEPE